MVEVAVKFAATTSPTTESLAYGVVVPMPTLPASMTVNTSLPPSRRFKISPAPDWLMVRRVEAEVAAIVSASSERTNCKESTPSNLPASNAAGTLPNFLRGESVSMVVDAVPPTNTSRYNVWLKLTLVKGVELPNNTLKRPLVTVILLPVRKLLSSSQIFVPPEAAV